MGLSQVPGCLTLPRVRPPGYQIAYRLASSSPNTFTTVEVGATVRQFTATELAPESAYIFRLSAKTRQGWGQPLEATVITTEKRGKAWRPSSHARPQGGVTHCKPGRCQAPSLGPRVACTLWGWGAVGAQSL